MKDEAGVSKILIIAPKWVGDTVFFLPAVESLGRLFPGARLTLLAKPSLCELHAANTLFSDFVPCPDGSYLRTFSLHWGLRRRGFDLAVVFPDSFSSALGAFLTRALRRIGRARQGRSIFLTSALRRPLNDRSRPVAREYLDFPAALGARVPEKVESIHLPLSARGRNEQEALFSALKLDAATTLVALCPGAAYGSAKCWPAPSYAGLARLIKARGWQPLLLGGPGEAAVLQEVAAQAGGLPVLKPSLPGFAACLAEVDAVVANDSGPLHMAAAVGTACLGLYGPMHPEWSGPVSPRASTLYRGLSCSPCYARTCPLGHQNCLKEIGPDEVLAALEKTLEAGGGHGR